MVLGACTGSDAHAVGIDAIMNMKGFAGDYGLERYPAFEARNLGAQVENAALARACRERRRRRRAGLAGGHAAGRPQGERPSLPRRAGQARVPGPGPLLLGGPRIDHRLALELGYDAGFGPGTKPSDVANYVVGRVLEKAGKLPMEVRDG